MDTNRNYDALITLQKKKESKSPIVDLDGYEYYTEIWAESRYLKGKNFYAARANNLKTDIEFIIRFRPDIDETMRIIYNGKIFEIEAILPLDNERLYRTIRAHEVKRDM